MERKLYAKLLAWKENEQRKPLLVQGARQVGKTYLLLTFAQREYGSYVYCNFEKEPFLQEFFDDLSPKSIVEKIALAKRKEIVPGKTLILFDEIQACPAALTSLKYFCEEAPEYPVVASGSLLGVAVHRESVSFPVGKIETLPLYPLDFEEYLNAKGESDLVSLIKDGYATNTPLPRAFHERALSLYREYLYVGGMPEAVERFIQTGNRELVRLTQNAILEGYQDDMAKYNRQSEIPKTRIVYKTIGVQLSKENHKFQYKTIKKSGRASEFESAIEWLCLSGLANQLFRLEQVHLPLNAFRCLSDFKFFLSDVGLLGASQDIRFEDIFNETSWLDAFKGGMTENYVFNQLTFRGLSAFYWTSQSQAEVDFILRLGKDIVPIEVKPSLNTRSLSLDVYRKRFAPAYAIRISPKNFGFDNGIKSVPLYAVFCIA